MTAGCKMYGDVENSMQVAEMILTKIRHREHIAGSNNQAQEIASKKVPHHASYAD